MSDFDTVLERLLLDPQFKSALAGDSARALAGYQLSDDEREVLLANVVGDSGTQPLVEDRISKASMAGLISSFSGAFGNVAEYEEVALGGPDTAEATPGGLADPAEAVVIKEVDPMPLPYEAVPAPGGLADPAEGVAEYEEIALGGPDTDPAEGVVIKEVDPMPVPDEAAAGVASPGEAVGFNPQPDPPGAPAAGPSPHMLPEPHMVTDPVGAAPQGGATAEPKMAPAELKLPTDGDHSASRLGGGAALKMAPNVGGQVQVEPELPSS